MPGPPTQFPTPSRLLAWHLDDLAAALDRASAEQRLDELIDHAARYSWVNSKEDRQHGKRPG